MQEEEKGEVEQAPQLDSSVRASIKRAIEERMSLSMIEEGMQGGWEQEHVYSSNEDSSLLAASEAPDKDDGGSNVAREGVI